MVDLFEIVNEASYQSKSVGKYIFFISGAIVCLEFFYPKEIIPSNLLDGMYLLLTFNFIGMALLTYKYRNIPHLTTNKCLLCQSRMTCIEIKCLDEFNKNCRYSLRLQPRKKKE